MAFANKLMNGWQAFDKEWFKKNQQFILSWVNGKGIKRWFSRKILRLDTSKDLSVLAPHFYTICLEDGRLQSTFRTHWKYAKRVYFAFLPIWWALHFIDWAFLDKVVPAYSFGFDTLTAYPQAGDGGGNVTCDGYLANVITTNTWATLHDAASGTTVDTTATSNRYIRLVASTTTDQYTTLRRSGFGFDTSALGSTANISSAVLSLYGFAKSSTFVGIILSSLAITSFDPATINTVANADFDMFGTTSFAEVTYSDYSLTAYNAFTLNAAGITHIKKTAPTVFGARLAADMSNSAPQWYSGADIYISGWYADTLGTTEDPKLVVTYTIPAINNYKQAAILAG